MEREGANLVKSGTIMFATIGFCFMVYMLFGVDTAQKTSITPDNFKQTFSLTSKDPLSRNFELVDVLFNDGTTGFCLDDSIYFPEKALSKFKSAILHGDDKFGDVELHYIDKNTVAYMEEDKDEYVYFAKVLGNNDGIVILKYKILAAENHYLMYQRMAIVFENTDFSDIIKESRSHTTETLSLRESSSYRGDDQTLRWWPFGGKKTQDNKDTATVEQPSAQKNEEPSANSEQVEEHHQRSHKHEKKEQPKHETEPEPEYNQEAGKRIKEVQDKTTEDIVKQAQAQAEAQPISKDYSQSSKETEVLAELERLRTENAVATSLIAELLGLRRGGAGGAAAPGLQEDGLSTLRRGGAGGAAAPGLQEDGLSTLRRGGAGGAAAPGFQEEDLINVLTALRRGGAGGAAAPGLQEEDWKTVLTALRRGGAGGAAAPGLQEDGLSTLRRGGAGGAAAPGLQEEDLVNVLTALRTRWCWWCCCPRTSRRGLGKCTYCSP